VQLAQQVLDVVAEPSMRLIVFSAAFVVLGAASLILGHRSRA
jgi:hypothetical protein